MHEDITRMEKFMYKKTTIEEEALLKTNSDSTEELQWSLMKPDNLLMKTLGQLIGSYAHFIEKELKQAERDIRKAKKVFNG